MKGGLLRRDGLACLIAMTLSSCASDTLLSEAALGKSQAQTQLPDYLDDCQLIEPHAPLTDGAGWRNHSRGNRRHCFTLQEQPEIWGWFRK